MEVPHRLGCCDGQLLLVEGFVMNIALADDGEVVYTREDGGAGVSEMSRNVDASVPCSSFRGRATAFGM